MLLVHGMVKDVPTVFVGLEKRDMEQLLNGHAFPIPTQIQIPEPETHFQIVIFGGEDQTAVDEHLRQLGATLYDADEEKRN